VNAKLAVRMLERVRAATIAMFFVKMCDVVLCSPKTFGARLWSYPEYRPCTNIVKLIINDEIGMWRGKEKIEKRVFA
jgi:hypothetical protein